MSTATVALVAAIAGAALSGCTGGEPTITDTAPPATPAVAPPQHTALDGTVLPVDTPVTAAVVDQATRTLALATTGPDRLLLVDLDALEQPASTVELPGEVTRLSQAGADGTLFAPVRSAGMLLQVDVASRPPKVRSVPVDGGPVAATTVGDRTAVALADRPGVAIMEGGRVRHTVTGFAEPADVIAASADGGEPDTVTVLDRPRTAVTTVDIGNAERGPSLRAGLGATNAVADRFGRVLVTNTRDGELLAFSADPLLMRQRYPVPGVPYAIAYDPGRDLAWVTLTEHNEVVGYDVAGGEPVERHRLATVRQPNTVAVDPSTGAVVVGSAVGDGVQVVKP